MGKCNCLPVRECRHIPVGASAGYQLNGRVDQAHCLCGLLCQTSVLLHGLMTDLPGAVHLISQAPYFDVVRVFHSVSDTHITVFCS